MIVSLGRPVGATAKDGYGVNWEDLRVPHIRYIIQSKVTYMHLGLSFSGAVVQGATCTCHLRRTKLWAWFSL